MTMTRSERLALWRSFVAGQRRLGWLPDAGYCCAPIAGSMHPVAPIGASHCRACGRVVLRGEGRWWE